MKEESKGSPLGQAMTGLRGLPIAAHTLAAFILAVAAVIIIAALSYLSLQNTANSALKLTRTVETMVQLQTVLSSIKDAETGQRGFLLSGRESYLEPFSLAKDSLANELSTLHQSTDQNSAQRKQLESLENLLTNKMAELDQTIALRRTGHADEALALVLTDRGKSIMDRIRSVVAELETSERQLIDVETAQWRNSASVSFAVTGGGSALLLILIAIAATLAARDFRGRRSQSWLRSGQIGLGALMQGDQPLDRLGANVLQFLAQYLDAQVGVIFIAEGNRFRRVAGFAMPAASDSDLVRPGEGLTGQAAKADRLLRVRDVPANYLSINSGTGISTPTELLICPFSIDRVVQAVIELGFFGRVDHDKEDLLTRVAEQVAVAVRASKDRSRLEELLHETQQQAQELQTREEELRVNNEELEEQGRSLNESRVQLESQQAELEQINGQLEEQSRELERQKSELLKSHGVLLAKTQDLQRVNQYKSEFLANMSHELRTPLNSTLILAKLLADNKEGNLNQQQVTFARTISSAGNDLLMLINEVLDLSRIEAGRIDLAFSSVEIAPTLESLGKIFEPTANSKKIGFSITIDPGAPQFIETDPQRLAQILRNLVANALKFTDKGAVAVRVFMSQPGKISFEVRDTGVGIPLSQQEVIFEAFRQADGSIHRKYGGTGLGLSISKDLVRLLGGEITVRSVTAEGSVFTVTLPVRRARARLGEAKGYEARGDEARGDQATGEVVVSSGEEPARVARPFVGTMRADASPLSQASIDDDRDFLRKGARVILVIEDDVTFATILRDLTRELGFQCVVTLTAFDGLIAASQFQPSAIVLDVNLPDRSGLSVLDQLKQDINTRHIPVHMASGADHRREALELGAAGYMLKPTGKDELVQALKQLETNVSQGIRRVLVVEDDPRQRESICQLLIQSNVQISAVDNAGDALKELKTTTFDCMVMDFNLPDLSGYDLLEKMAREDEISFPPVIVYTGKVLSLDEEQRLRRFSKAIIIKDIRSPERLLDEVSLFLRQVETNLPSQLGPARNPARNREHSLEGRRVLVVEDDVRNIFALTSVLEPQGASVDIARNGREALAALERSVTSADKHIDLVLMDIMMPEMDGLTAMREIRRRPDFKKLPMIALTAKAMKDDHEKCLAAGANDYMAKPIDVEKLLSLVRVWMPN